MMKNEIENIERTLGDNFETMALKEISNILNNHLMSTFEKDRNANGFHEKN